MPEFKLDSTDNKARVGKLITPHGEVQTPVFLPVGTQATVKALSSEDLVDLDCELILANTYHLYLQPGASTIKKLGGLHKFMNWHRPILTDSGGFQVFSLGFGIEHQIGKLVNMYGQEKDLVLGESVVVDPKELVVRTKLCKIEEEGPTFQSHIDGSVHFFSPEVSVETQLKLGADFIVALDECTSPLHDYDYTKTSMERSHRWEMRSLEHLKKLVVRSSELEGQKSGLTPNSRLPTPNPLMFGVVQGGVYEDLRLKSAKFVADNFFGIGIGGSLGSKEKMKEILDWINPLMDPLKPRHLLGIGTIDDIFEAVERGVDIFDCVHPTRIARYGVILSRRPQPKDRVYKVFNERNFSFDITKSVFAADSFPLAAGCSCYTCTTYSRAYLHHLFKAHELLAYRLASIHNIHFMLRLMEKIRKAISEKRFAQLKEQWLN